MKKTVYNAEIHHRSSIRLKEYDYSSAGAYFVTICVKNREGLFGEIIDGEMVLSDIELIIQNEWLKTAQLRNNVIIDEFIVMPNHFHGIVIIQNEEHMQYDNNIGRMQYAQRINMATKLS